MPRRIAVSLAFVLLLAGAVRAADLAVGAQAPPFELQGSDGKLYTLAQFAGKRGVVLAWFPKAFTPG